LLYIVFVISILSIVYFVMMENASAAVKFAFFCIFVPLQM